MQLLSPLALGGVQGLHPADVVPDVRAGGGRRHRHKLFGNGVLLLQGVAQRRVGVIVVDVGPAVFPEPAHPVAHFQPRQLLRVQIPVPAAPPECVGVQLPLAQRVVRLVLHHPVVGVGLCPVRGQLPEQQYVFRAPYAHLRPVLALLRPPQPVGLVVLPYHVRHHGDHPEVGKSVLHVVLNAHGVEGLHGGHSRAGHVAEQHPVFYVDRRHPPRLQDPQQLRGQVVHLPEEVRRVLVVAEVVVAGRVFVVVGKGNAGVDQPHRPGLHFLYLFHAVIVAQYPVFASDFHSLHPYAPGHPFRLDVVQQPELPDDFAHILLQTVVVLPFLLQNVPDLFLRLRVDHVNDHRLLLQEPVDAVDRLDKVVEFIVNAQENGPVAVPLEVASGPGKALLRGKQPCLALGKGDHPFFPLLVWQAPPDVRHPGDLFLNDLPFVFQIVPDQEMGLRVTVNDLFRLRYPAFHAFPLLPGSVLQVHRRVPQHLDLPVFVHGLPQVGVQDVLSHHQRRQVVPCVVVPQVRRTAEKQPPAAHPQPELFFLVGVQRQVVGLCAVPLEEPGQRLPRVHDLQKARVVDKLLVSVGAGRRRGRQLVFHPSE